MTNVTAWFALEMAAVIGPLQQRLALVKGWVELPVILDLFEDRSRAFEAAVCLIDEGGLLWGGSDYLSPTVFVRPVHPMN